MIEAVIFDVDGTLIDSVDFHAESWERAFARHGHDIGFSALRAQIGKGGDQLMPEFLSDAEVNSTGASIERERGTIFKENYLDRVKGFPGCADLFRALRKRGLRIALASSATTAELEAYKAIADVDGLTDVQTSSDDAQRSKPHPDVFLAALGLLELAPDRALVVGDTPYDAEAARKAGIASVGVLCGGFTEADIRSGGAARVYRDPADLLAHIDEWAV